MVLFVVRKVSCSFGGAFRSDPFLAYSAFRREGFGLGLAWLGLAWLGLAWVVLVWLPLPSPSQTHGSIDGGYKWRVVPLKAAFRQCLCGDPLSVRSYICPVDVHIRPVDFSICPVDRCQIRYLALVGPLVRVSARFTSVPLIDATLRDGSKT